MKRTILIPVILLISLAAIFQACHTNPFQGVNEQIKGGRWILLPKETGNIVEFEFTGDSITIYQNGIVKPVEDIDGNMVPSTSYTVRNQISNQYIVTDPTYIKNFGIKSLMFERTREWLVIKASNNELYLESLGKEGLKGEYQLEFYRE